MGVTTRWDWHLVPDGKSAYDGVDLMILVLTANRVFLFLLPSGIFPGEEWFCFRRSAESAPRFDGLVKVSGCRVAARGVRD